jgi:hypothetical protein
MFNYWKNDSQVIVTSTVAGPASNLLDSETGLHDNQPDLLQSPRDCDLERKYRSASGEGAKTGSRSRVYTEFKRNKPEGMEVLLQHVINNGSFEQYLRRALGSFNVPNCAMLAKNLIKFIEPHKQKDFPYKGKDRTKPEWWPVEISHTQPNSLPKDGKSSIGATLGLGKEDLIPNRPD